MTVIPEEIGGAHLSDLMGAAWDASSRGRIEDAMTLVELASNTMPQNSLCPELEVLRHNRGSAPAREIKVVSPTEDRVVSFVLGETAFESPDPFGMEELPIDLDLMSLGIQQFFLEYKLNHHAANAAAHPMPHVMVMSTGRCGTMSLYQLLKGARSISPYHTYWWMLSPSTMWEMQCRIGSGTGGGQAVADLWASTRAAEWLSAAARGRVMVGLNHLDTVWAPMFARTHPLSKFVHLHRDPIAVFKSFYAKNQWREGQLRPLMYSFSPGFMFYRAVHDLPKCIAWYVHFTETYARAMGKLVGPMRYLEISSDKLFRRDDSEILKLLNFIGIDITLGRACAHFETKINEKKHKVTVEDQDMAGPVDRFAEALIHLRGGGLLKDLPPTTRTESHDVLDTTI